MIERVYSRHSQNLRSGVSAVEALGLHSKSVSSLMGAFGFVGRPLVGIPDVQGSLSRYS